MQDADYTEGQRRVFGVAMHLPRILELRSQTPPWTQGQIAKEVGISQASVNRLLAQHARSHPAPRPASPQSRWPARGRPFDVLRFIDYCLDPKRPFVVNLNGGVGEMRRALREAEAGLRAAEARCEYQQALVDAKTRLVNAMEDLERLGV